ncbi:UbiX family flavin prenyltransferase [uncultured Rikenella sp.]|uniref:UbiX family flavin prenyltransferase n=1 Tax=uncultured Rikenella sp. TaxID=368003 RepID=UPI00261CACAF|nr:UbiX family flavin prenyltransferase [uncultured Rikenella sp.]
MKIAIGITGASGAIYAERLLRHLLHLTQNKDVEPPAVIFTKNGQDVVQFERPELLPWLARQIEAGHLVEYRNDDFFTPVASGSTHFDALVIVPCSMGMAGRIAGGISDDLISRAADVILKENTPAHPRTLILCPRETPLSLIHLRNLCTIREAGGTILPAMPSFYTKPQTIEEAVDTVIQRILSQLRLIPADHRGWQE